jgi:hypothetical protein
MGIVVCDGGTNLLRARKFWQTYSIGEILARFLKEYPDISFVAILTVEHDNSSRVVRVDVHKNPKHVAFATSLISLFESSNNAFLGQRVFSSGTVDFDNLSNSQLWRSEPRDFNFGSLVGILSGCVHCASLHTERCRHRPREYSSQAAWSREIR